MIDELMTHKRKLLPLAVTVVLLLIYVPFADHNDAAYMIAYGDWMLAHGEPIRETLNTAYAQYPMVSQNWLGCVAFATIARIGAAIGIGDWLLFICHMMTLIAFVIILFIICHRLGRTVGESAAIVSLLCIIMHGYITPLRVHTLTFTLWFICLYLLWHVCKQKGNPLWLCLLPVMSCLWSNTQMTISLVIPVTTLFCGLLWANDAHLRIEIGIAALADILAICVNPYGIEELVTNLRNGNKLDGIYETSSAIGASLMDSLIIAFLSILAVYMIVRCIRQKSADIASTIMLLALIVVTWRYIRFYPFLTIACCWYYLIESQAKVLDAKAALHRTIHENAPIPFLLCVNAAAIAIVFAGTFYTFCLSRIANGHEVVSSRDGLMTDDNGRLPEFDMRPESTVFCTTTIGSHLQRRGYSVPVTTNYENYVTEIENGMSALDVVKDAYNGDGFENPKITSPKWEYVLCDKNNDIGESAPIFDAVRTSPDYEILCDDETYLFARRIT